ncbi:hypothetical protein BV898_12264 [Hypsibius exemplaris]|uniref:LRAT domain-containing protein n=1 Tax=Hypsibius exemplaris TaxID=2072580 RepID=A0A1W0WEB3_HYPEX|nr:hypothetical protein BV898_12264 [Hypsibius exemplaris]
MFKYLEEDRRELPWTNERSWPDQKWRCKIGDLIEFDCPGKPYRHWGMFLGGNSVVHVTADILWSPWRAFFGRGEGKSTSNHDVTTWRGTALHRSLEMAAKYGSTTGSYQRTDNANWKTDVWNLRCVVSDLPRARSPLPTRPTMKVPANLRPVARADMIDNPRSATILLIGEKGLGKSTFLNLLHMTTKVDLDIEATRNDEHTRTVSRRYRAKNVTHVGDLLQNSLVEQDIDRRCSATYTGWINMPAKKPLPLPAGRSYSYARHLAKTFTILYAFLFPRCTAAIVPRLNFTSNGERTDSETFSTTIPSNHYTIPFNYTIKSCETWLTRLEGTPEDGVYYAGHNDGLYLAGPAGNVFLFVKESGYARFIKNQTGPTGFQWVVAYPYDHAGEAGSSNNLRSYLEWHGIAENGSIRSCSPTAGLSGDDFDCSCNNDVTFTFIGGGRVNAEPTTRQPHWRGSSETVRNLFASWSNTGHVTVETKMGEDSEVKTGSIPVKALTFCALTIAISLVLVICYVGYKRRQLKQENDQLSGTLVGRLPYNKALVERLASII